MTATIIEVTPKKIFVTENGNSDKSDPVMAGLVVSWYRPNGNNSLVTGEVTEIKLEGNKEYTKFPMDTPKELIKNQILKTDVTGRSAIKVEVIVAKEAKTLNKVFATLFGTAVGLISISNPFASALVGLAKSDIQSAIKKKKINTLGQGYVLCDSNDLPSEIEIELFTTRAIKAIADDEYDLPGDDTDEGLVELLGKNENNGHVLLTLNRVT